MDCVQCGKTLGLAFLRYIRSLNNAAKKQVQHTMQLTLFSAISFRQLFLRYLGPDLGCIANPKISHFKVSI